MLRSRKPYDIKELLRWFNTRDDKFGITLCSVHNRPFNRMRNIIQCPIFHVSHLLCIISAPNVVTHALVNAPMRLHPPHFLRYLRQASYTSTLRFGTALAPRDTIYSQLMYSFMRTRPHPYWNVRVEKNFHLIHFRSLMRHCGDAGSWWAGQFCSAKFADITP